MMTLINFHLDFQFLDTHFDASMLSNFKNKPHTKEIEKEISCFKQVTYKNVFIDSQHICEYPNHGWRIQFRTSSLNSFTFFPFH